MKKFLAPLMLSGLLVVAFAATGHASVRHGSVLQGCSFTAVPPNAPPGTSTTISGTGFQPDATLPISVNGVVVKQVTILDGGILPPTVVDIPGDAVAPITITIPCGAGGGSSVASSVVFDPGSTAALAFTGSGDSTGTIVATALAAIVIGAVLVLGTRRRSAMRRRSLVG